MGYPEASAEMAGNKTAALNIQPKGFNIFLLGWQSRLFQICAEKDLLGKVVMDDRVKCIANVEYCSLHTYLLSVDQCHFFLVINQYVATMKIAMTCDYTGTSCTGWHGSCVGKGSETLLIQV